MSMLSLCEDTCTMYVVQVFGVIFSHMRTCTHTPVGNVGTG